MRVTLFKVVGGAALLAMAAAPTAWAKNTGSYSVQCLSNDTALQQAEGITTPSTVGPVTVTIQPASLWPPNHKMRVENVTANLTQGFNPAPAAAPYNNGANITVFLTDITDDQVAADDAGGHGCGKPTAKQGLDWSPDAVISDPTSYDTASATLSDTTPTALDFSDQTPEPVDVKVRGERCPRDGARTYVLSVVCCDTTGGAGNAVCDDEYIQDVENNQSTTLTQASTTESLDVTVPKSQGHHH